MINRFLDRLGNDGAKRCDSTVETFQQRTHKVETLHVPKMPTSLLSRRRFAFPKGRESLWLRTAATISLTATLTLQALTLWAPSSLAKDPFRTENVQEIGDNTEAAFRAIFEKGNYTEAKTYLEQAESNETNEPLVYAMKASFAYMQEDLDALNTYASKTRETAEKLSSTNPLRGNLYTAVGHFLEGAYIFSKEGTVKGTPPALSKLRLVFQYLDAAEKIAPQDPEVNLLKGYMDLMLAVNMPFSNPSDAIERLENHAGPRYLAYRGIAVGYRDLDKYDRALESVEEALKLTPNNPEVFYLRAQILWNQGKQQKSLSLLEKSLADFDRALESSAQLPEGLKKQIERERNKTARRIQQMNSATK